MWAQEFHRTLVQDPAQEAFRAAIVKVVGGGATVLDVGTGIGLHALFACAAGARHVYAVEPGPVIEVARALAAENGYADRITFVRGPIEQFELKERVDVIVGNHGLSDALALLPGAALRFLRPGGKLIPETIQVFAAVVEAPETRAAAVEVWRGEPHGFSMTSAWTDALNSRHRVRLTPAELISERQRVARYTLNGLTSTEIKMEVTLPASRAGVVHGLGTWAVATLADGILVGGLDVVGPAAIWPHWFLPAPTPFEVRAGELIRLELSGDPGHEPEHWRWRIGAALSSPGPFQSTVVPEARERQRP